MTVTTLASNTRVRDAIVEHLVVELEKMSVEDEPFSHFVLSKVFPDDIYTELLEQIPDPSLYSPLSLKKHSLEDGTSTRDTFALDDRYLPKLPASQRDFWENVTAALRSDELKRAVFQKLGTDLRHRFQCSSKELDNLTAYAKPALILDLGGYEIKPHPDTRSKIVTMLIYLPSDCSQSELGTSLYRRKWIPGRDKVLCRSGLFEAFKRFPFLPNTAGAFAVGRKSWHGREMAPLTSQPRHTIAHIYYGNPNKGY